MKSNVMRTVSMAAALFVLTFNAGTATAHPGHSSAAHPVTFQQIRNATVRIEYAGTRFLIDPLLAEKDAYPGFPGTLNSQIRWPRVGLPAGIGDVTQADAIIVTHTHEDHWDAAARERLSKTIPIFAQNENDANIIRKSGFTDVRVLGDDTVFRGTRLTRIKGQHYPEGAPPAMIELIGEASGVIFQRPGSKTVYVAGDTVWTPEVTKAIKQYRTDVIVLNAAYALLDGSSKSIIMGKEDLLRAYHLAPKATVIASHMDTINHAGQSRKDLNDFIRKTGMDRRRVLVPLDGQIYRF